MTFSFTKIPKLVEDKHPLIQDLHFELNPLLCSIWSKKNPIYMVIGLLKTTPSSLDLLFSSTNSLAIKTTSKICLPLKKSPWDMKMASWRTLHNRPNSTLAMILYELVTRLVGLKFKILLVWLFLKQIYY